MPETFLEWSVFGVIILLMLALDLFVFHRHAHEVSIKEALLWSGVWIAVSLLFNLWIYFDLGEEKALQFLAGYLIEKSLSVDNIFVFVVIFSYFSVPAKYQHRILFWGIIGAVVMRGILIVAGITLINQFHWIIYLFGAFLIYTGFKMAFSGEEDIDPDPNKNPVLRFLNRQKWLPIIGFFEEGKFFIKQGGRRVGTSMFVVLIVVETTDVMFALDSIPAILSITTDPFLVFSSNIFAILGLRALYFAVAGIMEIFYYLRYGLAVILAFVGVKMLIARFVEIPVSISLGIIALILLISVVASLQRRRKATDITAS